VNEVRAWSAGGEGEGGGEARGGETESERCVSCCLAARAPNVSSCATEETARVRRAQSRVSVQVRPELPPVPGRSRHKTRSWLARHGHGERLVEDAYSRSNSNRMIAPELPEYE